jgi:hypothetical protein
MIGNKLYERIRDRVGIHKTIYEIVTIIVELGLPYIQSDEVFLSLHVVVSAPLP